MSSKLSCEIRVVGAENVETGGKKKGKKSGSVFVRMYLGNGNGNGKVQLSTREVPVSCSTNGGYRWDQTFSLECNGAEESVRQLRGGSVTLELRWRPTSSGSLAGWAQSTSSKLLGKAELAWGPAFGALGLPVKAWVPLGGGSGLVVEMAVAEVGSGRRRVAGGCREGCGCRRDGCGVGCGDDYELFALAAALEGF